MTRTFALLLVALTLAALALAPDALLPPELARTVAQANPVAVVALRIRARYCQAARTVDRLPPW
ncbi:MAG: hypothetical protein KKB13_16575 [Chloroflexi bacterium]|nr:hypothetical protein [Chloroflexota bacterium]